MAGEGIILTLLRLAIPLAIIAAAIWALISGWIWLAGVLFVFWILFADSRRR